MSRLSQRMRHLSRAAIGVLALGWLVGAAAASDRRLIALAFDPDTHALMKAEPHALYRSTDEGRKWQPVTLPNAAKEAQIAALLTTIDAAGFALAAETKPGKESAATAGGNRMDMNRMMQGGMMQGGGMGGMMDMMGMMEGCNRMMKSASVRELPAGNEKLQLKMHAEMMQKMGEILARYVDQIKDEPGSAR